jgi:hypothetical protein
MYKKEYLYMDINILVLLEILFYKITGEMCAYIWKNINTGIRI